MIGLDREVRALLVCPACRGELDDVPDGLECRACALRYPVVDGVPWLIRESATRIGKPVAR